MKSRVMIGLISLFFFCSLSASVLSSPPTQNNTLSPMLKNVMPSVVNIVTQGELLFPNDPFIRQQLKEFNQGKLPKDNRFTSVGSGVIIDPQKGIIITNAHVVASAKFILVTLNDGRHFPAKKIGADNPTDIAIIQIDSRATSLHTIPLGDSNQLNVGDFVVAVGSPFGLNQSVTSGIVSGLHRSDLGIEGLENFIQTDAPINMGNSGGALVNMRGELVGINTALISNNGGNIGIGFAIPINMVKSIVTQLAKFGKVRRGLMGILVQTLTPDLADAFKTANTKGAIVSQVLPFSPADAAGIKVGDIITAINKEAINSNDDVHNIIGLIREGETVDLTILREGKTMHFSVKTNAPKTSEMKRRMEDPYWYGVRLQEVTESLPNHGLVKGIKVMALAEYSPASMAGLLPGDIIISANHEPAMTIDQLKKIAKPSESGLLLNIIRGPGAGFVVIK